MPMIPLSDVEYANRVAAQLEGTTLMAVAYQLMDESRAVAAWNSAVYEVDEAIALVTSDGTVKIEWDLDGSREGLAFDALNDSPDDYVDVSSDSPWRYLVGQKIVAATFAWHARWNVEPHVWSLRMTMQDDLQVVVALGDLNGAGMPTYTANAMVVLFDREIAKGYQPSGSNTSAWGSD